MRDRAQVGGRAWIVVTGCVLLVTLAAVPPAEATFPGANGKLAFSGVYTMNPDGTGITHLTSGANPAWSPDGTKLAFATSRDGNSEIYVMNADGSSQQRLTSNPAHDTAPSWSPDGRLAFSSDRDGNGEIYVMNADGSGQVRITNTPENEREPQWSPSGSRIAFGDLEIYTIRPDGSGRTLHLVDNSSPSWAPNGQDLWSHRIYYDEFLEDYFTQFEVINVETGGFDTSHSGGHLVDPVVSPDGQALLYGSLGGGSTYVETSTGSQPLPGGTWQDGDWQPIPANTPSTYVRPAGATPLRISLVPAFNACTAPNRTHGPPLAFDSCSPPAPGSPNLTVGVGDGDPAFSRSVGFMRLSVFNTGSIGPPPDETDVSIRFSLSNVMRTSDLSEYTGGLRATAKVRLTDRPDGIRQTTQDFPLAFEVPCVPTAATLDKSLCETTTSLDTIIPGAAPELTRAIWALDQVRVYDGGPDEDADTTADNSLFAVQGVFVP